MMPSIVLARACACGAGKLVAAESMRFIQNEDHADHDDRAEPCAGKLTDLLHAGRRTNEVARLEVKHQSR